MNTEPPSRDPNRAFVDATEPLPDRRHPYRLPEEFYRAIALPMVVTACSKDRMPLLVGEAAELVVGALTDQACRFGISVCGYCVMPDHIHLVITQELPEAEFMKFMRHFKSEAARRINAAGLCAGKFRWQRTYWDKFVEGDGSLAAAVQYVLENPVRRGLCERADDWPHSAVLALDDP